MGATFLDRKTYSVADAARILRVPPSTLRWWLEGGSKRGKTYPPVIRPSPTGEFTLTWAEFVESGLLCQYRRELHVRLHEIRAFIDRLREEEANEHPLALHKPWVGEGSHLLLEMQKESGLPGELWLIAPASNQLVLTDPAASFLKRVEWEDGWPIAWRPHQDEASPVRCLPVRRFGRPSIEGISTEAIVEHLDGGEDEIEVAEQFGLGLADVQWAQAYELSRRTPLAA